MEKMPWKKIYKQECYLEIFCTNSFDDSTNIENLGSCGLFSLKAALIFLKNSRNFRSETIQLQGTVNLSSYDSISCSSGVLCEFEDAILQEWRWGCSFSRVSSSDLKMKHGNITMTQNETSFLSLYIYGKGVAPSPTPWCCSCRKGSLRVTLNYGQLYIYQLADRSRG